MKLNNESNHNIEFSVKENLLSDFKIGSNNMTQTKSEKKIKPGFFKLYWRILKLSFEYKFLFIVANIAVLITSFTQTSIPFICGKIVDSINNNNYDNLIYLCQQFILIAILTGIFGFIKGFCYDLLGSRVVRDLRMKLFEKLVLKDIDFYDSNRTGDLVSRIGSDISVINNSASENFSLIIKSIITFFISFTVLFYLNSKLTMYILIVFPPIICSVIFFRRFFRKLSKQYQNSIADSSALASEIFANIRIVKSFSMEKRELNKYYDKINFSYQVAYKKALMSGILSLIISLLAYLAVLFVLWIGGMEVLDNKMTSGQLSSFILYSITLSGSVISLSKLNQLFNATAVSEKIFKLIDEENKIKELHVVYDKSIDKIYEYKETINKQNININDRIFVGNDKEFNNTFSINIEHYLNGFVKKLNGNIVLNNVSFKYPTKNSVEVLSNININVKPGEKIALVGSSGSGKSTIVNLLERFYDCSAGEILYDNINIKNYNLESLHSQIGLVSQEPTLFSGTIRENIVFGEDYSEETILNSIRLANAFEFINDKTRFPLGLETIVGERGIQLSGGQKQRIAISRALIKNPKILIFDEATSALDSESEYQVQLAIEKLMSKGDTTMIIVAHRLSTIINCDRILVMKNGKIVEEGNHEELMKENGYYRILFDKQVVSTNSCN